MRRFVAALVAASFALNLIGCGGTPAPTTTAEPVAAPPVASPAAAAAAAAAAKAAPLGLSANEGPVFMVFPSESTIPTDVAELVAAKQPTLVYFYDRSQNSSKETRKIIDAVLADNRGLVELVAYDIGRYVSADPSKPVVIGRGFAKDAKYQASVSLAKLLGVTYTPYIVLTDSQGYIVWKFKGLSDRDVIEREVLRASN